MRLISFTAVLLSLAEICRSIGDQASLLANDDHGPDVTWLSKYGPQIDQAFSGPLSFSHLPYIRCLEEEDTDFDIAILGIPFDTGVTYRNGAWFGPYAIRSGSRRQRESRGYTMAWGLNPYTDGLRIIDCGDVRCLFNSLGRRY